MKIEAIIFDLGNVLVQWNPANLYQKFFEDQSKVDYFLNNICTMDWHTVQDAGRTPEEGTEALVKEHPGWEHPIRAFYARWKEMFSGPIEGSVQILKELKEKGYKLYALSNWNAELYNRTVDDFPFLTWFDGKVISGEVKLKKPDEDIYQLLLQRFALHPKQALFIDDNEANIATAQRLDIESILFTSPEALRTELQNRNILSYT
jgi:2-haloacid dehalogenase